MKALTLTQPWATLVATGNKRIETRSWSTTYKGPLAVHAAKGLPVSWRPFAEEPFVSRLQRHTGLNALGSPELDRLPRGMVVATCRLVAVRMIERRHVDGGAFLAEGEGWSTGYPEREFGDFQVGRFAWLLADVVPLETPIPAIGKLGLWEWAAPGEVDRREDDEAEQEALRG